MTVYRVENSSHRGPYRDISRDVKQYFKKHDGMEAVKSGTPPPNYDPELNREPKSNERCAFESMESLKTWFTDEDLEFLKQNYFNIVEYQIADEFVEIGKYQVIVTSNKLRKVA